VNTLELVEAILPLDFSNKTLKESMDAIPSAVVDGILESPDRKTLCLMVGVSIHLKRGPIKMEGDVSDVLMLVPVHNMKELHDLGRRAFVCLRAAWCERRGLATVEWPATISGQQSPRIGVFPEFEKQLQAVFESDGNPPIVEKQSLGVEVGRFKKNNPHYS
jgi:hypothetical protein